MGVGTMFTYILVIFSIILIALSIRYTKGKRILRMAIGLVFMFSISSYPFIAPIFLEWQVITSLTDVAGVILMYAVLFCGGLTMVVIGLFTKQVKEQSL